MARKKKGSWTSRICAVVIILALAGTMSMNILFILHTTSRGTSQEKEPMEYDHKFHNVPQISVAPPAQYWLNGKGNSLSREGTYFKKMFTLLELECMYFALVLRAFEEFIR